MKMAARMGVLLQDPGKIRHLFRYLLSRLRHRHGMASIPQGGHIYTSSFSEYLSVYGLMPNIGELAMIKNYASQATEIFDVGANVGVWTVLMKKANPQTRVHSFEPNPSTFDLLIKHINLNTCQNVLCNSAAVSDIPGQLKFQVPRNASIFGRVEPGKPGNDNEGRFTNADSFSVPAIRLDEYCAKGAIGHIDFLKMDVEGHELAALKGLGDLIAKRRVKAIYIETIKPNHDRMGTRFSEMLSFILDCGYRFHTISQRGTPEESLDATRIMAHNHLCLPR